MNDVEVLTNTLNATLQRHAKVVQNYEVEIANLTAEMYRLKKELENVNIDSVED